MNNFPRKNEFFKQGIEYKFPTCAENEINKFLDEIDEKSECFIIFDKLGQNRYLLDLYKVKRVKNIQPDEITTWLQKSNRFCMIKNFEIPLFFNSDYTFSSPGFVITHTWHSVEFSYQIHTCQINKSE